MDLSAINEIARRGFLPTKKLSDVEHDHSFMVIALCRVKTKYGPKYVAGYVQRWKRTKICLNNMAEADNKLKLFITCKNSGVEFNIV